MHMGFTRAAVGAVCGFLAVVAGAAHADVTIERTMSVEGVGAMAFGNMSGTTKTTISGDRSRSDSNVEMKSKLVRMLAHGATGPSADIIRLDDEKILHLNINKKEYTETTFQEMRDTLKRASEQMNQAGEERQPSAVDDSKCDWLPPKSDVKRGEKASIAGFDAERYTIQASQPCKDKQTGSICEVTLVVDEWLAASLEQNAEAQRFYKAYAAKLGLEGASSGDISQRAQSMFSQYKGIWTEIAAKMQGAKGFPVKTSFVLALGGQQCQNANAQQAQSSDSGAQPTSPSALAGAMASKLGGLFGKKKSDAEAPAGQPAGQTAPGASSVPLPAGDVAIVTISSQLVSISNASAAADAFQVPADFKKVESRAQKAQSRS